MSKPIDAETALARYFYEQCAGSYSGHMANVPNNPTLFGIVEASGAKSKKDFAALMRRFADALESDNQF